MPRNSLYIVYVDVANVHEVLNWFFEFFEHHPYDTNKLIQ